MHTSTLFSFWIVLFSAWAVYGGMLSKEINVQSQNWSFLSLASWYPRAFGFRRSLEIDSIADARQNLMPRHGGEAKATFRPTGTGVSPPAGTGCPYPIIGVAGKGNSVVPQGCPGPFSASGSVAPSGTGTAVSAGTGLPTRVANVTVASTGFPLPVGTVSAAKFNIPDLAAPTVVPGSVRGRYGVPYGIQI